MKKYIASSVTISRMVLAISLLWFLNYDHRVTFLIIYSIAWFTDAIDGTIARLTKTQSDLGSKLDDIADTLLGAVMGLAIFMWLGPKLFQFLPYAGVLIAVRVFNIIYTKHKYGKPYVTHTYGNKATSFIAFLLPISYVLFNESVVFFYIVIVVGVLASIEESIIHISSVKHKPEKRSIFISLPADIEELSIEDEEIKQHK